MPALYLKPIDLLLKFHICLKMFANTCIERIQTGKKNKFPIHIFSAKYEEQNL